MQEKTAKNTDAAYKQKQPRTQRPMQPNSNGARTQRIPCNARTGASSDSSRYRIRSVERFSRCGCGNVKRFRAMWEQKRQAVPYYADAGALSDSARHWRWAPTSPCSNDMQARQFHVSSQNRTSRRQLYASSQNRTSGRQLFSSRGDGKERHAVKPSSIEQFLPRGDGSSPREGSPSHRGNGSS